MSDPGLATRLLRPRSVALVGASGDPEKPAGRILGYLRRHGYAGPVWPINPRHRSILGEPALATLAELPGPVDHAYILVAAGQVPGLVAECGERGIGCVSVLAGGFAEAGAVALQDRLKTSAREHRVRLLGPNSMGVINLSDRVALSVSAALEVPNLKPGWLGVLSHSGGMLGTLLSRGQARGIGFSKLVSVGNEADLGVAEIGEMLVDDPATRAILLFLETIRRADRFEAMTRRAAAAGKPVIAYMLGRSEAGGELAAAHTGALAGPDRSADAFLRDCGVMRVDMLETLFELPALVVAGQPPAPLPPPRTVAVMTTTGGGGALVVDRLALAGIEVVPPPEAVLARLADEGIAVGPGRLTDLTLRGAGPEVVGPVLDALLASPHCQAVVVVVGSSAQFRAEFAVRPIVERAGAAKPLAVFLAPQAERSLARLADAGVAAFRTPEACADAMRAWFERRPPRRPPERPPIGDPARAARLFAGAECDTAAALAGFAALGVPCAEARTVTDLDRFGDAAGVDFYPVAAKILSPDIPHKARLGGVVLPIADRAALERASRQILAAVAAAAPRARRAGILVQRLEAGVAEAIVGYRRDPRVGPMVMVGSGGAMAEAYDDVAVRRAPVSLADARAMIAELRGLGSGDTDALASAICAVSDLARVPGAAIEVAEINPLIVKPEGAGVVAVDGLVVGGEIRKASSA